MSSFLVIVGCESSFLVLIARGSSILVVNGVEIMPLSVVFNCVTPDLFRRELASDLKSGISLVKVKSDESSESSDKMSVSKIESAGSDCLSGGVNLLRRDIEVGVFQCCQE